MRQKKLGPHEAERNQISSAIAKFHEKIYILFVGERSKHSFENFREIASHDGENSLKYSKLSTLPHSHEKNESSDEIWQWLM